MAGKNTAQIRGGFVPNIYFGPPNPTFPVNGHVEPDDETFVNVGLNTDDGITFGKSLDVQRVKAMGITNYPVYTRITSQESTISFTLMQTSSEVIAAFNRITTAAMATTAAASGVPQFLTITDVPASQPAQYSLIIDLEDGIYKNRKCYPTVEVADTGDQVYTTTGDPLGYQFTFDVVLGEDGTLPFQYWENVVKDPFPLA